MNDLHEEKVPPALEEARLARAAFDPPPPRAFPGVLGAIGLIVMAIVLQGVLYEMAAAVLEGEDNGVAGNPWVLGASSLAAMLITVTFGLFFVRQPITQVLSVWPCSFVALLLAVPAMLGLQVVLSDINNLVHFFLPMPEAWQEMLMELVDPTRNPGGAFFAVAIAAPIGEELLFRGLILDGLLRRYKAETAIVISAVLFGLIHLNPWQGVGAVFLGIALGWFRWKTGSVFLPIVGHFVNNAFAFGFMYLLDIEIRGFTTIGETGEFQPVWFTLGGAAVAAVCFWGLVVYFQRKVDEQA